MLIDDPMKNWAEAHSAAARDKVMNQYLGTLRNRLDSEDTPIVLVHHRYHADDISGRLLAAAANETGEKWEHVKLPAIAGPNDPLGREEGEALWPERFPLSDLRQRHIALGSYLTAALEQQEPSAEEGTEILRAWFQLEETLPTKPDQSLMSWDLKMKDKEAGDYVVGGCWWRVGGGFWLMDQIRGRYDHATTANAIALLSVRHPEVRSHVIEAAGAADVVMPLLKKPVPDYEVTDEMANRLAMNEEERAAVQKLRRRGMSGLIAHPVKGDKSVRARAYIAPIAEAGDLHLPADAHFVAAFLDEMSSFPNGSHDDQVDQTSQALQRFQKRKGPGEPLTTQQAPDIPKPVDRFANRVPIAVGRDRYR